MCRRGLFVISKKERETYLWVKIEVFLLGVKGWEGVVGVVFKCVLRKMG